MSLLIYTLLGFLIFTNQIIRKKIFLFDALLLANLNYFLFYSLTPILFILYPSWMNSIWLFQNFEIDYGNINLALISLLGYLLLIAGWNFGNYVKASKFNFKISENRINHLLYFGVIIGVIAFFAFTSSMGGIFNAIFYGSAIRYGYVDLDTVKIGNSDVFRYLINSLEIVVLFFSSKYLSKYKLRKIELVLFLSSCIFLFLYLLAASSRGAFFGLVLAFVFISSYKNNKHNLSLNYFILLFKKSSYILIFSFFLIFFGKQFFAALPSLIAFDLEDFVSVFNSLSEVRQGDNSNFLKDSFVKESSHGMPSLLAAINRDLNNENFLWFRDFYLLPIHLIPSNLIGITTILPPTVSAINTNAIQGELIASIPPAILGMLYYNAGFLGLLLMFFYGFLGKFLQKKFFLTGTTPARDVFLFYFVYLYGSFIGNGDIKVYVYDSFAIFLLLVFLYFRKLLIFLYR